MPDPALVLRTPASRLREARRQLIETGCVSEGLIDPALARSWQRSRDFGLAPTGRAPGAPHASGAQLARALDHQRELVSHARPVIEFLCAQTSDNDSMVVLADGEGTVLQALGDAGFIGRAERIALRPGAIWHEQWRGTNAVGIALADGVPSVVHANEHYLERNSFLTCTAAPIADSSGRVLGVLDISGDHRGYQRHTLALVRSAARMIENRLFDTRHAGALRLRLHTQPEGIGTFTEALIALGDDGRVAGANAAALAMFGLPRAPRAAPAVEQLLQLDLATLCEWSQRPGVAARPVRRHDGSLLWARVEAGRLVIAQHVASPRSAAEFPSDAPRDAPSDALSALDTGDAAMQAAISRARRVLDKPIALLLQGESGTGKELLARAVHNSSARRGGPFVAVNCAALPETLIEAELFGYRAGAFTGAQREGAPGRLREAHGGTLFLDEIGDMPLALQGRLLRVLQEREVLPLGGGKPVAVDFQLVCATHRQLRQEMEAGRFREDLYYRLNGLMLQLPPLRERRDMPQLIARMLKELLPGRELALAPELAQAMARHRWPGNLRQLNNALRTACALLDDTESQIDWPHLSDDIAEQLRAGGEPSEAIDENADLRAQSQRTIRQTVDACEGNLSEAARRLGISRNTLYRKLKEAGPRLTGG